MKIARSEDVFGNFKVWREPEPEKHYIVGVDTAEGKVRDKPAFAKASLIQRDLKPDFSAAIVIERETGRHCATWHGDVEVTEWSYIVCSIGFLYNTALLAIEVNSQGNEVVNTAAKRVHYPNLYRNTNPLVVEGDDLMPKWGWFTNAWNRGPMFGRGAEILVSDPHCTKDKLLADEIRTIEIDDNGVARAKHPNKDDCVLAWLIALQARWEYMTGQMGRTEDPEDPHKHLPAEDRAVWKRWDEHCDRLKGERDGMDSRFHGSGMRARFARRLSRRRYR